MRFKFAELRLENYEVFMVMKLSQFPTISICGPRMEKNIIQFHTHIPMELERALLGEIYEERKTLK
jgi:hypothetical protein